MQSSHLSSEESFPQKKEPRVTLRWLIPSRFNQLMNKKNNWQWKWTRFKTAICNSVRWNYTKAYMFVFQLVIVKRIIDWPANASRLYLFSDEVRHVASIFSPCINAKMNKMIDRLIACLFYSYASLFKNVTHASAVQLNKLLLITMFLASCHPQL